MLAWIRHLCRPSAGGRTTGRGSANLLARLSHSPSRAVGHSQGVPVGSTEMAVASDDGQPSMNRFDYVVVGAGSAGCVIAARLSEDPQNRVLLLEAGAADGPANMEVPSAWPELIGSDVDWRYATVPQLAAGGMARLYPRGKVLGGSSSINGMVFLRGHRSDYDEWVASGAVGWGYQDLLPFFKRSETAEGRDLAYRGDHGPMRVAPAR